MQDIKHLTSVFFHYGLLEPEQGQEKSSPIYQQHNPDKSEASVTRFNEDKKLRLDAMAQFEGTSRVESERVTNRLRRQADAPSDQTLHPVLTTWAVAMGTVAGSVVGGALEGGAAGSMGGPLGSVVGAAAGAVVGMAAACHAA